MKSWAAYLALISVLIARPVAQVEKSDPYSTQMVSVALANQSKGLMVAKSQTHLARLGDGVGIALLKVLSDHQLSDGETVHTFLPIVRGAFDQPQLIVNDADRTPSVTFFLLRHIRQEIHDSQIQSEIDETMRFVSDRLASSRALH